MDTLQENSPVQEDTRTRLTLRDAVRLAGVSEKTLRRKLEAGLLTGHRETLDYGGFMWMINPHSLAELYPDSAAVRDYVDLLESSLQDAPPSSAPSDLDVEEGEVVEAPAPRNNDFVIYLLEENRNLKDDLRDRERQLRSIQERAMNLERECGEQRGTAATQARVLEWFQQQPQQQPAQRLALSGETPTAAAPAKAGLRANTVGLVALLFTLAFWIYQAF